LCILKGISTVADLSGSQLLFPVEAWVSAMWFPSALGPGSGGQPEVKQSNVEMNLHVGGPVEVFETMLIH